LSHRFEPPQGKGAGDRATAQQVPVWDPFVRVFHWTLVVAFTVAYLTEDDLLTVHVWAGYVVGILVVARIVWGFVGSPHARFSDFVYAPAAAFSYVRELLLFRGARYLGQSPGGGYMVILLLIFLAATVVTGLVVYGGEQQAGPLAGLFSEATGEAMEEWHEVIANITLALIFVHIRGRARKLRPSREPGARHGDRQEAALT